MKGSDVAMLEDVLWHFGISPQAGFPGMSGARINSSRDGTPTNWTHLCGTNAKADRRDVYSGGWFGCTGAANKGLVSLEGMVNRFQARNVATTNDRATNAGQVSIAGVDGAVVNTTLDNIERIWKEYLKAYDKYLGRPFIGADDPAMQGWLEDGPVAIWENGYTTILKPTYTEARHEQVLESAGLSKTWKTRVDLIRAWKLQESKSQWGEGSPRTSYRATEGSGDELGSIGFAQIVYRYRYGKDPCKVHDEMKMDFFDPEENLKAFAAHTASAESDCPGSFDAAFVSGTLKGTYKSGDNLRGYYPSNESATAPKALGAQAEDDIYELLAKGVAGYNGGVGFNLKRSWPDELKETSRTDKFENTQTTSFSAAYSINIRHTNYGLPYRTYVWKGGVYPAGTANAGQDWCFAYGEKEWMEGDYTWSDARDYAHRHIVGTATSTTPDTQATCP